MSLFLGKWIEKLNIMSWKNPAILYLNIFSNALSVMGPHVSYTSKSYFYKYLYVRSDNVTLIHRAYLLSLHDKVSASKSKY